MVLPLSKSPPHPPCCIPEQRNPFSNITDHRPDSHRQAISPPGYQLLIGRQGSPIKASAPTPICPESPVHTLSLRGSPEGNPSYAKMTARDLPHPPHRWVLSRWVPGQTENPSQPLFCGHAGGPDEPPYPSVEEAFRFPESNKGTHPARPANSVSSQCAHTTPTIAAPVRAHPSYV